MAIVSITVTPVKKGDYAANRLGDLVDYPDLQQQGVYDGLTGRRFLFSEGSVSEYLKKRQNELGGPDAYVRLSFDIMYEEKDNIGKITPPSDAEKLSKEEFNTMLNNR